MQHEVLVWSQATLGCNICTLIYELYLKSSGHYCCLTAVSAESATRRENIVCLLLQLLLQPGVNAVMASVPAKREVCVVLGYAVAAALSCVSQERINVSAVPTSPQVFFQPFTLCFVCRGFSQQYRQWTARQLALWVASAIQLPFQYPGHLPKPGIKPMSLTSLTLAGRLPSEPPGKNKVEYSINGDCNYYYCSDKCLIFLKANAFLFLKNSLEVSHTERSQIFKYLKEKYLSMDLGCFICSAIISNCSREPFRCISWGTC